MVQDVSTYHRYCPDQPTILNFGCGLPGRRRVNYPYCSGCPFNDDEQAARSSVPGQANVSLRSAARLAGRPHSRRPRRPTNRGMTRGFSGVPPP